MSKKKLHKKMIRVGDFKILLESNRPIGVSLESTFMMFEEKAAKDGCDVRVFSVIDKLPLTQIDEKNLLFEARNGRQQYFSVYEEEDGYLVVVYSQVKKNKIHQVAVLNKDLSEWTIYDRFIGKGMKVFPLLYPMAPLVFYYLTVKYEAAMIHASGVFEGEKGRLFTGFSGNGKSTMASIWDYAGSKIVNDDRLILRKENGKYFMYNTPMIYIDESKKAPLDAIYLIEHGAKNRLERIEGARAVAGVLAFCIQQGFKAEFLEHHLEFFSKLCEEVPVYKLSFVPDVSVIDFIKEHGI